MEIRHQKWGLAPPRFGGLPPKSFALLAFSLLLLSSMAHAGFTTRSLTVFANINLDGSANVEERLYMEMDSQSSRDLYETTRSAYSDLATWQNRTGLSEMRHHVSRAAADITDLRITPQSIDHCNSFLGTCYATVVLDYTVAAGMNGSGLIKVDRYKPRTAKYSLQQDALSFEQTKTGDLVIPEGTNITLSIPQPAEKIYFSSPPQNFEPDDQAFRYDSMDNIRYYVGSERVFTWRGDSLSKFEFTYEIESPLESEVLQFFQDSQQSLLQFFFGPEGLAAIIIIAAGAASVYQFNRLKLSG